MRRRTSGQRRRSSRSNSKPQNTESSAMAAPVRAAGTRISARCAAEEYEPLPADLPCKRQQHMPPPPRLRSTKLDGWQPRNSLLDAGGGEADFFSGPRSRSPRSTLRIPEGNPREAVREVPKGMDEDVLERRHQLPAKLLRVAMEDTPPNTKERCPQQGCRAHHHDSLSDALADLSPLGAGGHGRVVDENPRPLEPCKERGEDGRNVRGSHRDGAHGFGCPSDGGGRVGGTGGSISHGLLALEDLPRGDRGRGSVGGWPCSVGSVVQHAGDLGKALTRWSDAPKRWDFTSDLPCFGSSGH